MSCHFEEVTVLIFKLKTTRRMMDDVDHTIFKAKSFSVECIRGLNETVYVREIVVDLCRRKIWNRDFALN